MPDLGGIARLRRTGTYWQSDCGGFGRQLAGPRGSPLVSPVVLACLMLLACLWSPAVAQDSRLARQVFPDPAATLAEAVAAGDAAHIQALAAGGADLSVWGDKKVTMLQWALLNKSKRGLTALLKVGADPSQPGIDDDTVVHLAAMANDPAYLTILLQHRADPNAPNGTTRAVPLVSALMGEREDQFAMLLKAGADPGRADRTGNTPLHEAAKINEPWRVLDLLEAGADPRAVNVRGATFQRFLFRTPDKILLQEVRQGRAAVIEWLKHHNVAVEAASGR